MLILEMKTVLTHHVPFLRNGELIFHYQYKYNNVEKIRRVAGRVGGFWWEVPDG